MTPIRKNNIRITDILKEKRTENLFEQIINENFLNIFDLLNNCTGPGPAGNSWHILAA